jgi:hypothetical protein
VGAQKVGPADHEDAANLAIETGPNCSEAALEAPQDDALTLYDAPGSGSIVGVLSFSVEV